MSSLSARGRVFTRTGRLTLVAIALAVCAQCTSGARREDDVPLPEIRDRINKALLAAVAAGRSEDVRSLLARGASPDAIGRRAFPTAAHR